jgi:hypothetical protein
MCKAAGMAKRRREPDYNEAALNVVKMATGSDSLRSPAPAPTPKAKNAAAALLGHLGGLKGGKARAKALTAKRRKEIARKAGLASGKRRKEKSKA